MIARKALRGIFPIILAVPFITHPGSAFSQLLGDRIDARDCAQATAGDVVDSTVTIVCGMPREDVMELVRLAASPEAGDREQLFSRLNALLPASSRLRVEAIARFFEILGEKPVEETQLADRFAQIAEDHVRLVEEVRRLRVDDPEVQALREEAAEALQAADHDTARAKLNGARQLVRGKRQVLAGLLAKQQREESALVAEQAGVERARLNYEEAAKLFVEAESLLPAGDADKRWTYRLHAADAWSDQGTQFVDKMALDRAIESLRSALRYVPREQLPQDWAMTQNNLGNALQEQGTRTGGEAGRGLLGEAVSAYRNALEVYTRDQLPQQWAATQNNLGGALVVLGERKNHMGTVEKGRSLVNEVFGLMMEAGQEQYRAYFEKRLREIDGIMDGLKQGAGQAAKDP